MDGNYGMDGDDWKRIKKGGKGGLGVEKSVTLREMSKLSGNTVALVLRTLVSVVIGLVT